MRPVLHVAVWTWAALLVATAPYALYPAALVYGAGVAELARRYSARIVFWASLSANPYAWLAAFLGVVGFLGPTDDMNLGAAIGALSLLFLLLGAAALAAMAWSRRPVWAAAAALLWAVFFPGEALPSGLSAWLTLPLGTGLAYLTWPWRVAARP